MAARAKTITKLFALQHVLAHPGLTKADGLVLAILIEFTNGAYGYAWPGVETIAAVAGLKKRAVQYSLRRLENVHIVTTESGGGRGKSSRYRVQLDAFDVSPLSDRIKAAVTERAHSRAPLTEGKGRTRVHPFDAERVHGCAERVHDRARNGAPACTRTLLTNPSYRKPSARAASSDDDGARPEGFESDSVGGKLAAFERWWRENKKHPNLDTDALDEWLNFLTRIASDRDWQSGDPIGGRAARLYEEVADYLNTIAADAS